MEMDHGELTDHGELCACGHFEDAHGTRESSGCQDCPCTGFAAYSKPAVLFAKPGRSMSRGEAADHFAQVGMIAVELFQRSACVAVDGPDYAAEAYLAEKARREPK